MTTAFRVTGLFAALTLASGCFSAPPPRTVTVQVERGRIERLVVATGTIEPAREVEVRSRISGIIDRIRVVVGETVSEGTPLIEIERELLGAQLAEARASLLGAVVEARYSQKDLARTTDLRRQATVAQQEYDRAMARAEAAQAAVARGEAIVHALDVQLGYATVTAPIAGTILDIDVQEGSAVASVASVTGGTRLLTIAEADKLHLKGLVDETEVRWVKVGQPARVRMEGNDLVYSGVVRQVKPLGERTQNVTYFEVKVDLEVAAASLLRPRMSADAEIVTDVVSDALIVPENALQFEGDEVFVEAIVGGASPTIERRPVRLGIVDGARVQVLAGLEAGDEICVK